MIITEHQPLNLQTNSAHAAYPYHYKYTRSCLIQFCPYDNQDKMFKITSTHLILVFPKGKTSKTGSIPKRDF